MHSKKSKFVLGIVAVLGIWVAIDFFAPIRHDIRDFDPDEIGRLDAVMWRSYYDKQQTKLFFQLAELLRKQYGLPYLRSHLAAYYAAKAAFVFKEGQNRTDYEKALPELVRYYQAVQNVSVLKFDVEKKARLELEWWVVHREHSGTTAKELVQALADAAAALFHVPSESLEKYAQLRAEAMAIRDTKAEMGGVSETDWQRIETLLHECWQSLFQAVQSHKI